MPSDNARIPCRDRPVVQTPPNPALHIQEFLLGIRRFAIGDFAVGRAVGFAGHDFAAAEPESVLPRMAKGPLTGFGRRPGRKAQDGADAVDIVRVRRQGFDVGVMTAFPLQLGDFRQQVPVPVDHPATAPNVRPDMAATTSAFVLSCSIKSRIFRLRSDSGAIGASPHSGAAGKPRFMEGRLGHSRAFTRKTGQIYPLPSP